MTALSLHVSSDSALFSLPLLLLSHGWVGPDRESSSLTVPCDQSAAVWLIAASFPFLPFKQLSMTLVTTVLATGFLPMKRPGLLETDCWFCFPTYHLFTGNLSLLARWPGAWYVCGAFGCKKGFTALFLSLQSDLPPTELSGDLGFVSEVNQTCVCSKFADSFKQ